LFAVYIFELLFFVILCVFFCNDKQFSIDDKFLSNEFGIDTNREITLWHYGGAGFNVSCV